MPPYQAAFPVGTLVRVGAVHELRGFQAKWKLHHPLTDEQIGFAGREAEVVEVGYHHGGDPLYGLHGVPGLWHEECLRAAPPRP
jgi:hypothetical protein